MLAPNHRTIPSVQFRQMHGALAFVFSVFVGGFAFLVSGLLSASKMNSEQGILRVSAAGLAFAAFFLFARQPVKISIRDNIVYCRKLFTKKFDLGNFAHKPSFWAFATSTRGLSFGNSTWLVGTMLNIILFCVCRPGALVACLVFKDHLRLLLSQAHNKHS